MPTKDEMEETAEVIAEVGVEDVDEGLDTIAAAADVEMASRVALAAGSSDITAAWTKEL